MELGLKATRHQLPLIRGPTQGANANSKRPQLVCIATPITQQMVLISTGSFAFVMSIIVMLEIG
jgi:hypothetical protein